VSAKLHLVSTTLRSKFVLTKRFFDVFVSFVAILLSSPIILLIAFGVYRNLGLPILFRQARPGKSDTPFDMFKFRTMRDAVDKSGNALPDYERITRFGSFLRSTSLDELPGLFNVLKGDMSLVGPRPLLLEYLPLYNEKQARRHNVLPGITGWAQVNGRNAISWEEKFELDIWYVDNQSFILDLKILLLTIGKVFSREGVTSSGHVTIETFRGSSERQR
jgi:lipopolysaccharide/colanic/teichoic acid biosynthesis glycosyltransferase